MPRASILGRSRLKHTHSWLCGFSRCCQCSRCNTKVNVRCDSVFAAGDTCKFVLFVCISNDATWLLARRKNIIQYWLRSILAFFTSLKINTWSQVIEIITSFDCLNLLNVNCLFLWRNGAFPAAWQSEEQGCRYPRASLVLCGQEQEDVQKVGYCQKSIWIWVVLKFNGCSVLRYFSSQDTWFFFFRYTIGNQYWHPQ